MIIVFEGIDGCGKDTQIKLLRKRLDFTFMRYPTNNFSILNDYLEKKITLSSKCLFHLFLADIANEQEKLEAVAKTNVAVLSRYVFSTIAYEVDGISYEQGKRIVEATSFIKPDLVLYLDITPETAQERKRKQKQLDSYEKNLNYLAQVRANYLRLYEEQFLARKWVKIDGSKSIEEVHAQILSALRQNGLKI